MSIPSRTLRQICEAVADDLGALEQSTATGGSTTTLVCASYPFKDETTSASTAAYVGCEVLPTDGDEDGEPRRVKTWAPSTGTFTVTPAWSTGPASTDTFDIFKRGIRYDMIKKAVNKALRERRYVTKVPLTLVPDGDMENSDTSSWGTAVDCAMTKVATAGNLFKGTLSGRVKNTAANGYQPSASIPTTSGKGYYLEAEYRAAVGTPNLSIYDVTNSAEIDYDEPDNAGTAKGKLSLSFTVPEDCYEIAVHLRGEEATADIYWDDVILHRQGAIEMPLPDYITEKGHLLRVVTQRVGQLVDEDLWVPYPWHMPIADLTNPLAMWRVQVDPPLSTRGVWLEVKRPYTELSLDTSTTTMPREWIELAAEVELLDMLRKRSPGQETEQWKALYNEKRKKLRAMDLRRTEIAYRRGFSSPAIGVL